MKIFNLIFIPPLLGLLLASSSTPTFETYKVDGYKVSARPSITVDKWTLDLHDIQIVDDNGIEQIVFTYGKAEEKG